MTQKRPPQPIRSYGAGLQARNQERREQKRANPQMPDLAQAAVAHDPGNPRTLNQMREEQHLAQETPEEPKRRTLSAESIAGLQALKQYNDQQLTQQGSLAQHQPPPSANTPAPLPEASDPEKEAQAPLELEDQPGLGSLDDSLLQALQEARRVREQLEAERRAVEKRLKPIDLADGLLSGEFTQEVPIVEGKLTVTFRSLTPLEDQVFKRMLHAQIQVDESVKNYAEQYIGFLQTVASVARLNSTAFDPHLVRDISLKEQFLTDVFERKVKLFQSYPSQLLASLGKHSSWFDRRVNELFITTDPIKNG